MDQHSATLAGWLLGGFQLTMPMLGRTGKLKFPHCGTIKADSLVLACPGYLDPASSSINISQMEQTKPKVEATTEAEAMLKLMQSGKNTAILKIQGCKLSASIDLMF